MTTEIIHRAITATARPDSAVAPATAMSAPSGHLRPEGAAGNVWDALTANPGATVANLTAAAQVSRATVTRTLATLEADGRAIRVRGGLDGGVRVADTWTADVLPAAPDAMPDTTPEVVPDAATGNTDDERSEEAGAVMSADGTDDAPAPVVDEFAEEQLRDVRAVLTGMGAAVAEALAALDARDAESALRAVDTIYGSSGKARRLARSVAQGRARCASGRPRSAPGEMRAKVAAHLTTHPGSQFTPHEVSKVLGHSAGAVSNALDRLVEAGEAELVCERPRRFTAVPGAATEPAAASGTADSGH